MPEDVVRELRGLPARELARLRSQVRVLVISGLGLNCEVETAVAFGLVGANPEVVHLLDLLDGHSSHQLTDYRIVGFVGATSNRSRIALRLDPGHRCDRAADPTWRR
jgi:hypothetical protein